MMGAVSRYWHTLKYLKPIQFYGRLKHRLHRPRVDERLAPLAAEPQALWLGVEGRQPSLIGDGEFVLLGEVGSLADIGWDGAQRSKLWRYNQHYFDDLNAVGAPDRVDWHRALLSHWVAANPAGVGTGWEPYPISLRLVNWLRWQARGNVLPQACVHSMAVQARWLSQRMEWHLLGNHLFVNAKALVMVGLAFQGDEAQGWLNLGLDVIRRELVEQVLPDGGNFELSPMYHAIFLEDVLDLIQAARVWPGRIDGQVVNGWCDTAARMVHWLQGMTHPDGEIALFNDAAVGVALNPARLTDLATQLGIAWPTRASAGLMWQTEHFSDSGYVRVAQANAVALLDVARVGPDYLPGHAHADTLSFELSLHGSRVVVNGGTSRYGLGPEREFERSTAAHSTVEINGCSSSEVWSGFRVARRAYPFDLLVQGSEATGSGVEIACSHDGYRRLPGSPVHRRSWVFSGPSVKIRDLIVGPYEAAVARFILHPDVQVLPSGDSAWTLSLPGGAQVALTITVGEGRLCAASYAERFGHVCNAQCIEVRPLAGQSEVLIMW